MYLYFLELNINNISLLSQKIIILSNPTLNIFFLICLVFITLQLFFNKIFKFILINLFYFNKLILALTNTLFLIHPIILYITICNIFLNVKQKHIKHYLLNILIFLFSLFLGGFWSLQELNWGGWWNWDVLECGILLQGLLSLFYFHFLKKKIYTYNYICIFKSIILITVYTFLNKLGVATSIHAFISSKLLKINYIFIYLCTFLIIFFFKKKIKFYTHLIILLYIYIYLKMCIFFKIPFFFCIYFYYLYKNKIKFIFIKTLHLVLLFIILIIYYFNYYNNSFFFKQIYPYIYFTFQVNYNYPIFIFHKWINFIFIWNDLFLIKPQYIYNYTLNTCLGKNFNIYNINLSFLK